MVGYSEKKILFDSIQFVCRQSVVNVSMDTQNDQNWKGNDFIVVKYTEEILRIQNNSNT